MQIINERICLAIIYFVSWLMAGWVLDLDIVLNEATGVYGGPTYSLLVPALPVDPQSGSLPTIL
jgi:hypothetical protein